MKYLLALVISPLLLIQEASACYKCAVSYADPHIQTFDENKFQCQGQGDFIMSKSTNTDFELQGRFYVPETGLHSGRNGSSTVGAVLKTGVGNEAKIEVQVTPPGFPASSEHDCDIHYWVNGIRKEFNNWDATDAENSYMFKRRTRQHADPATGQRYPINFRQFHMLESKVILWMSKGFDPVFGCHMNFQVCVPCDFEETHDLVGLFGSPNNDKTDDFTTRSGDRIGRPPKLGEETTYCKSNWCVGQTKNSLFLNPDIREQCTADEHTNLDELVENADDEIKQECEGEVDCITDTIITGDLEIGKRTLEGEHDLKEHDIEEEVEPTENDKVEEDDAYTCTKAGVGSETAFAAALGGEGCFLDDGFKRWGWSLELDGTSSTVNAFHVYAAAGQCDLNKGDVVGTVTVAYDVISKECIGEYQAIGGHTIQEWQFYCGTNKYPVNKRTGKDSVAPGMYSCVHVETESPIYDTCKVESVEPADGKVYAIAHAVSCNAPETMAPSNPPTASPTSPPTSAPSGSPTAIPTAHPTLAPTEPEPSGAPTGPPTDLPTSSPTAAPTTAAPTSNPTLAPTDRATTGAPTSSPTSFPTHAPSTSPTVAATTAAPTTGAPTGHPTLAPTEPEPEPVITASPTAATTTGYPTEAPSTSPTIMAMTDAPTTKAPTSSEPTDSPTTASPTTTAPTSSPTAAATTGSPTLAATEPKSFNAPPKESKKGSGSGDPHFKTWTGDKYDYHGECDLVLVDHPSFADGLGLRLHIRTTRVKYFSFIEKVALQIGKDVLEFDNDVENFFINGKPVEANRAHHKTMLAGYVVRRDKKAISVRLQEGETKFDRQSGNVAKIDFHTRKNGFPAVIVDAGHSDIFDGSLGLLGDWGTGRKLGRDGKKEFVGINGPEDDATEFALEWQVRATEPRLFQDKFRFPQFPHKCLPPAERRKGRLGESLFRQEAEEACAHWDHDKEDCIFDVMATRDVLVAEEGHISTVE